MEDVQDRINFHQHCREPIHPRSQKPFASYPRINARGAGPPPEKKWKILTVVMLILLVINLGFSLGAQQRLDALQSEYNYLLLDYDDLQSEYDLLQSQQQNASQTMSDWYETIASEINFRAGNDQGVKAFVTPDDPEVRMLVRGITGGWSDASHWEEYWDDLQMMYDWVVNNVEYSNDSPLPIIPDRLGRGELSWEEDYWSYPNETIERKHGDCEDQANLLCSMILCYNDEKYTEYVIGWQNDQMLHLAVALPVTDDKLSIFDPAGKYRSSEFKPVREAVNDWLNYWNKYSGIHVYIIYSTDEYRTFSSTEEFIQWILERW